MEESRTEAACNGGASVSWHAYWQWAVKDFEASLLVFIGVIIVAVAVATIIQWVKRD